MKKLSLFLCLILSLFAVTTFSQVRPVEKEEKGKKSKKNSRPKPQTQQPVAQPIPTPVSQPKAAATAEAPAKAPAEPPVVPVRAMHNEVPQASVEPEVFKSCTGCGRMSKSLKCHTCDNTPSFEAPPIWRR